MGSSVIQKVSDVVAIRSNVRTKYQFIAYSFIFTYLILGLFIWAVEDITGLLAASYIATIPLYYYLLFTLLSALLLPLLIVKKLAWLIVIPKVAFDIILIGDFFVFSVYRFHIDAMFINMLIYDFKGIGISGALISFAVLVAGLVTAINIVIYRKQTSLPALPLGKLNIVLFLLFLIGQFIHVVGYEYKQQTITKHTPYFPYYQPLTSSSLMASLQASYPTVFPERSEAADDDVAAILQSGGKQGLLTYPKQPLSFGSEGKKPNILMFVAESWRQDSMNADITPNIRQFADHATNFTNHYSGGSVTVTGLFSLMYGLHPTYRDYMTANPYLYQTLLTKTLAEQGYDIDVYTSSNLDRFSLKAMFFGKIAEDNYNNPTAETMDVNDAKAISALIEDLKQPTDKPWFKFVFVSSSHHSYYYPEEHKVFTPVETNAEAFVFNKFMDGTGLFNDFKNSMHYVDKLFGDIWQVMEQRGLSNNTLSIVTSDHGEEFNDNQAGYWGHGSNFTDYQVAVPLIIKQPGQDEGKQQNRLTGHIDIVPTILEQSLSVVSPSSDYSNGHNLFDLPKKRHGMIMASYKDKAYLIGDHVYATGLSVKSYLKSDIKVENPNFDFKALNQLKQQERSLLK